MKKILTKSLKTINYIIAKSRVEKGLILDNDSKYHNATNSYEEINCFTRFFNYTKNIRIPARVLFGYGGRIKRLNHMLSGETISFITDAKDLTFEILYRDTISPSNMSLAGACGIDVYLIENNEYLWRDNICPTKTYEMHVTKTIQLPLGEKKIILYLPSYASIDTFKVRIKRGTSIKKFEDNSSNGTLLLYGSSITQGCAASRPGLTYANILGRELNLKVENYGYSESALGQESIIQFIANRHADIYVLEYDHNASLITLRENYFWVYSTIRNSNKKSLIILMSRFSGGLSISLEEERKRNQIISETYEAGINSGDKRLIYINGTDMIQNKDAYFSDDRHPNDMGMNYIANVIAKRVRPYLASENEYDDEIDKENHT